MSMLYEAIYYKKTLKTITIMVTLYKTRLNASTFPKTP